MTASHDEQSDEVAFGDTRLTVLPRETVEVKAAIDPPARHLTVEDLVGRWNLPQRKVIVPLWLRSWENFRGVAWWLTRWLGYQVTFHITRAPKYGGKAFVRLVVGSWRALGLYLGWLLEAQGRDMARKAFDCGDQGAWNTARKEHHQTKHRRLLITGLYLLLAATVVVPACLFAPPWAVALALVAGTSGLVQLGRPESKAPLFEVAMASGEKVLVLTSKMVVGALGSLGLARIDKALREQPLTAIKFDGSIQREAAGFQVTVELPSGATATQVIDKREELAAGLRRPLGCVWPEAVKGRHPAWLSLFVGFEDMNTTKQKQWPLLRSGSVDLFKPQPFGIDQRGRVVPVTLMYASVVIGSIPRIGKTFSLRELLLIAALDPRCQVHAHDNKGSGDLSALEHVAHAYTVGDDEGEVISALESLRELQDEMRRRYKVIRKLPKELRPESKVTPALASRRDLGLHPVVVSIDECQVWFEHPKHGDEFTAICTDLVKRGPAAGIVTLYATQRPDAKALPSGIQDNVVLRYCLKVMDATANNMVLGSGRYAAGVRATMFAFEDKGIGYLVGDGADAQIVKTF